MVIRRRRKRSLQMIRNQVVLEHTLPPRPTKAGFIRR